MDDLIRLTGSVLIGVTVDGNDHAVAVPFRPDVPIEDIVRSVRQALRTARFQFVQKAEIEKLKSESEFFRIPG